MTKAELIDQVAKANSGLSKRAIEAIVETTFGEPIKIPASRTVGFKPAPKLKKAL